MNKTGFFSLCTKTGLSLVVISYFLLTSIIFAEPVKKDAKEIHKNKTEVEKTVKTTAKTADKRKEKEVSRPLPIELIQEFTRTFDKIRKDYVEPVDDKTILTHAIKGMLAGLDPHSNYLDIDSYKEIKEGTTGEFSGLGMEVGVEDKLIKVISPIDNSPAVKAGVKAGDLILKINNKPTRGMSLSDAVKLMRGKVGTTIKITVLHEEEKIPVEISITREVIKVSSVKAELLQSHYAYARISSFQSRSAKDLKSKIEALTKKNKNILKGLILDLRNNPGGILTGAIHVSDLFLNKGLVVYTKGRKKSSIIKYSAVDGDILNSAPIVVLVNKGSASASEIVAGALQDHKRAIIMGQQTFGKGSVQTILPMSESTAIKLTTARYYTPSDRSIQAKGITPDVIIENWKLDKTKKKFEGSVKEADLTGHLENTSKTKNSKKSNKKITKSDRLEHDYLLNEALILLKGLNVLSQKKA